MDSIVRIWIYRAMLGNAADPRHVEHIPRDIDIDRFVLANSRDETIRRAPISADDADDAQTLLSRFPGYRPSPLISLGGLAAAIGVGAISYKHEADRFGLGSFKALGGGYATAALLAPYIAAGAAIPELVTATDGNHGRAVAWAAKLFSAPCQVFVHEGVSSRRREAIEAYGARVVVVQGTYDDAVRAAATAARDGGLLVSDTTVDDTDISAAPRLVMAGYTLLVAEIDAVQAETPTHIFIQAGVGALAASVCFEARRRWGLAPKIVIVEPSNADCLLQSARLGRRIEIAGDLSTAMAGLACGAPSALAWPIIEATACAFLAVPDEAAFSTMRLLARSPFEDPSLVAGESAVCGLAGLIAAVRREEIAASLSLDSRSRVLVFGTEGATDPVIYERIVGVVTPPVSTAGA